MSRKSIFTITLVTLMITLGIVGVVLAQSIGERVSGYILLQVEQNGEAWYIFPETDERYYLGRPADAFEVMRNLGLGIAHNELNQYLSAGFPPRLLGMIMLDVEQNGEAYYVYPGDNQGYYLGRPADAFEVMRNLGLGISDSDLNQITIALGSASPTESATDGEEGESESEAEVSSSVIVDTNQTQCYNDTQAISCPTSDSYFGQDANYTGTQPSYTDNGDGTITDNNTGLMWLEDAGDKVDYYEGVAQVNTFSYAGYSDWRVPSIKELYSLMDFSGQDIDPMSSSASNPFIDDDVFVFEYGDTSAGDRIIDSQWMTSSIYVSIVMSGQECFFGVNFADGRIKCYPTQSGGNNGYFMRLVRGSSYGVNDFVDNDDETISDLATGLIWQQGDSSAGMQWAEALDYCEDLELAGFDDWRLPNAKELQSIVDYARSPDTTGSPAIDPIFSTSSITNELGQADYPFFWTGTTHASAQGGEQAVYISFGRALGKMNGQIMDVHGAGAQRSDPKSGDPNDYPQYFGPQGDVRRLLNFARCVR